MKYISWPAKNAQEYTQNLLLMNKKYNLQASDGRNGTIIGDCQARNLCELGNLQLFCAQIYISSNWSN